MPKASRRNDRRPSSAGTRWFLTLAACLFPALVFAGENEADGVLRELVARYEAVNAELGWLIDEMDNPAPLADAPVRALSLRRNAVVAIGGEFRTDIVVSRNKSPDPHRGDLPFGERPLRETRTTDFKVSTARLRLDARLANRWRLYADFNIQRQNGFQKVRRVVNLNAPGDPDPVADYRYEDADDDYFHQAYIELVKNGHSGFGFRAGLIDLPFGLGGRPELVGRSFLDAPNLTGSYLMNPDSKTNAALLPHASRFLDPVVAALVSYELRDIIRFEGGFFQEREGNRVRRIGGRSLRSESTLPLSYQVGFSVLPLDGWELSATFRNRHSRSRGLHYWANSPYRPDFMHNLAGGSRDPAWDAALGQWRDGGGGPKFGSRRNEQAFSVGLAVEIPNTNLSALLEYAHGWNQGFNRHIYSDNINFGLSYRLLPRLTLHGQAEWLRVEDASHMARGASGGWVRDTRKNNLYRFLLGAEYEFLRGLTLEAGWQYEYWRHKSVATGDRRTLAANAFYVGTRFIF